MKKIFIAFSALFMAGVVAILIVLNCIDKNVNISHAEPSVIRIYNKSTSPTVNTGYDSEDDEYAEILTRINEMTNLSYYTRLINLKTLDTRIEPSISGTFMKWSSEIKSGNLVIELEFTEQQDVVVYDGGNTRVISFYVMSYVISKTDAFSDILVYYSNTNASGTQREESYAKNDPLVLKGFAGDVIDYADEITAELKASANS